MAVLVGVALVVVEAVEALAIAAAVVVDAAVPGADSSLRSLLRPAKK